MKDLFQKVQGFSPLVSMAAQCQELCLLPTYKTHKFKQESSMSNEKITKLLTCITVAKYSQNKNS